MTHSKQELARELVLLQAEALYSDWIYNAYKHGEETPLFPVADKAAFVEALEAGTMPRDFLNASRDEGNWDEVNSGVLRAKEAAALEQEGVTVAELQRHVFVTRAYEHFVGLDTRAIVDAADHRSAGG